MHIVYDNIVFSLQRNGGISVVWQELLTRMMNSGVHNLHFIEYQHNENNPFRKKLELNSSEVILKSSRWLNIKRYLPPRININEPFIFHSSYFRTCSNKKAINVTTVHDFTYEYFRKGLAKYVHCWQKYRAIRKSSVIVCISENTKRDLLRFLPNIDAKRVHVIYNGVSEDYYVIKNKETYEPPFPPKTYLVFVGSRVSYKNFELVIRGVSKSNYNLVIAGPTLTEKERETINCYIPSNRYKAVGFLSNKNLNVVYNYAAALAYPSSYEGFGIPVIEAQKAGCPVIAYKGSSIPEIIGETPLLMNELTEEELLKKIELLSDTRLVGEIRSSGLENSKRFSWDNMVQQYLDLYDEALLMK